MGSFVDNALLQEKYAIDVFDERRGFEQGETVSELAVLADERAASASEFLAGIRLGATAIDDRYNLWQEHGAAADDVTNTVGWLHHGQKITGAAREHCGGRPR